MNLTPVKPTSRQAIWTMVRELRTFFGVVNKLYFDIVAFVENVLPELIPEFVFDICTSEEMGDLHGETIPSKCTIRLREDVYIGACKGKGRDRFTLAHELGHLLMHDESSIVFCKLESKGKIPTYRNPEWQADVFGGELLAPSYLISNMTKKEIREECIVSGRCAKRQLQAIESEKKKRAVLFYFK